MKKYLSELFSLSSATVVKMEEISIKKFYDGAEIFITGGSGFVGRVLIEKLLRSCEGISKIFLLMRAKKGIEARKRIEKLTDCMVRRKKN